MCADNGCSYKKICMLKINNCYTNMCMFKVGPKIRTLSEIQIGSKNKNIKTLSEIQIGSKNKNISEIEFIAGCNR